MNMNYIPSKPKGQNGYTNDNSPEVYPIDPNTLEWCQFCAHYGWVDTYNACADGSWFKIMRDGPLAVSYCGWCKHFVNKFSPEGKAIKYSKYKQWILDGMYFKQDREK